MAGEGAKWTAEAWCVGVEGATKVFVQFDELPDRTMMANLRGAASSTYRRAYQAWPTAPDGLQTFGDRITRPDGTVFDEAERDYAANPPS